MKSLALIRTLGKLHQTAQKIDDKKNSKNALSSYDFFKNFIISLNNRYKITASFISIYVLQNWESEIIHYIVNFKGLNCRQNNNDNKEYDKLSPNVV